MVKSFRNKGAIYLKLWFTFPPKRRTLRVWITTKNGKVKRELKRGKDFTITKDSLLIIK